MGHALVAIESYAKHVVGGLGAHPLLGRPTLSVGLISGGISVNTVPDACAIEIDRRLLPDEDPLSAQRHAIEALAAQLPADSCLVHEAPFISAPGLRHDQNQQLAEQLGHCASRFGGGRPIGVPYGTDAPFLASTGAPTVVFGPGAIAQAHTCDEWVAIDQLEAACEILQRFVRESAA
jgi:acetylornithine deacetylase